MGAHFGQDHGLGFGGHFGDLGEQVTHLAVVAVGAGAKASLQCADISPIETGSGSSSPKAGRCHPTGREERRHCLPGQHQALAHGDAVEPGSVLAGGVTLGPVQVVAGVDVHWVAAAGDLAHKVRALLHQHPGTVVAFPGK